MLHFLQTFLVRSQNVYILTWITNPNILILIPPSEVQEYKLFKSTLLYVFLYTIFNNYFNCINRTYFNYLFNMLLLFFNYF